MDIRCATKEDEEIIRSLWEEFEAEVPDPVGMQPAWDDVAASARKAVQAGLVWLAMDDMAPVGLAWVSAPVRGVSHLEYAYVRSTRRHRGVITQLLKSVVDDVSARGATDLSLDVVNSNNTGKAVWAALGFRPVEIKMAASLTELQRRLSRKGDGSLNC